MKLLIQDCNYKFFNNIRHTKIDNLQIYSAKLIGDLYALYYQYKFDYMIFSFSDLTNEILQFVAEFGHTNRIFIYHDKEPNQEFINSYKTVCTNLVHEKFMPDNTLLKIISIPDNLLNHQIFMPSDGPKLDQAVCFLDGLSELPLELESVLYPYTRHRIKLFNNNKIHHAQNLGILSEIDKARILNISKYYILINNDYLSEAITCNCSILDLQELSDMIPRKYATVSNTHQTYYDFILENIL
jgi:hypothetical protein